MSWNTHYQPCLSELKQAPGIPCESAQPWIPQPGMGQTHGADVINKALGHHLLLIEQGPMLAPSCLPSPQNKPAPLLRPDPVLRGEEVSPGKQLALQQALYPKPSSNSRDSEAAFSCTHVQQLWLVTSLQAELGKNKTEPTVKSVLPKAAKRVPVTNQIHQTLPVIPPREAHTHFPLPGSSPSAWALVSKPH